MALDYQFTSVLDAEVRLLTARLHSAAATYYDYAAIDCSFRT